MRRLFIAMILVSTLSFAQMNKQFNEQIFNNQMQKLVQEEQARARKAKVTDKVPTVPYGGHPYTETLEMPPMPPKPTWKDYLTAFSPVGMNWVHPDVEPDLKERFDYSWDPKRKLEIYSKLTNPEDIALLNRSRSESHYNKLLLAHKYYKESMSRIANEEESVGKVGKIVGASIFDPIILILGVILFKVAKITITLKRIAYAAIVTAGLWAVHESLLSGATGKPIDMSSAAFYALICAGLFALSTTIVAGIRASSNKVAKTNSGGDKH